MIGRSGASSWRAAIVIAGIGLAAAPALAQTSTVVIAPAAPPPPQVETIPPPPAAVATWIPGHWAWNGVSWDWIPGQYVSRPAPQATWVPGYWAQQGGGYVWVPGHWSG